MFAALSQKKKQISDGNKLRKFFSEDEKPTTQFKALHAYGSGVSQEERKEFHQKNFRRAFSVCRSALDEYAKRGIQKNRNQTDDIKRPIEIIEALSRLCQDIPQYVKQNWNHNALSDLFCKFLNFNTNEEIRLKCVTFVFVVINAAKDQSHPKFVECLKFAADITPFCSEKPYDRYYHNFKKNLIVAQDALPWSRTGSSNTAHALSIISATLALVKDSADFDFWYRWITKHILPQFYHECTCKNAQLVAELFSEEEKHELDREEFIEKDGFGSAGPPPAIQTLMTEWVCGLFSNESKNQIMLSKKIYILYAMDMIRYSMQMPMTESIRIYHMLTRIERWLLGIDLSNKFMEEIQSYYQMIIQHLFLLFTLEIHDLNKQKLHQKLNLVSYAIYLLRLISGEPYIKLSPATWTCLINGIVQQIKYYQETIPKIKSNQQQQQIEERVVHPLIYCLFKAFVLVSISDTKTANVLLAQFQFEIPSLLAYEPFVIQWREIMRNLTIELLLIISPKDPKDKKYKSDAALSSRSKLTKLIPSQSLEMDSTSQYFAAEQRLQELSVDIFEFQNLDQAFMIWDRLLHLLGSPVSNSTASTRQVQLEGFSDTLKIFVSALGIKEHGKSRKKKQQALEKIQAQKQASAASSASSLSSAGSEANDHEPVWENSTIRRMKNSIYGFPHSLISVPIDVSRVALLGNLPQTIRENLPLPSREQLPQGDTLIDIFGPWLFDICLDILLNCSLTEQLNRLNEFRMCFGCLSDIFLTHCEITFDELYLATYYRIIKLSFGQKVSGKIRTVVIHECAKGCIFGKNLVGVNCLISDFLEVTKSIIGYDNKLGSAQKFSPKQSSSVFQEQDTNDSLTIIMSMICFAAHFDKLNIHGFSADEGSKPQTSKNKQTFASIKGAVADIFAYVAHFDNLPKNVVNTVVWGSVLIIYDEVSSSKDVKIISTALKSIVNGTNINKLGMAGVATRAIESVSPICDEICKISPTLITKTLFLPFLLNILEFVKSAANQDSQIRNKVCKIGTHQIYCCLEWMFRFPPTVLTNAELMTNYFKMIHSVLVLQTKLPSKKSLQQNLSDKHPLADLILAAVTSKMMLFHYLGNFPLAHDSGAISSDAADDYMGSQEANVFLSYDSNVLITANDRALAHQAGPEPGVRFLLRDESGKFAWNFTPCSIQSKPILSHDEAEAIMVLPKRQKKDEQSDSNKAQNPPSINQMNKKQQKLSPLSKERAGADEQKEFTTGLTPVEEKRANVFKKTLFQIQEGENNKEDQLKQVLNYVSRELTPPTGKRNQQIYKAAATSSAPSSPAPTSPGSPGAAKSASNKAASVSPKGGHGSFPSGGLSDKSRAKLAKYMADHTEEELDLYKRYEKLRKLQMEKLQKLQSELRKDEEKKEDGERQSALNAMKIREAVTGFDCSRFLLSHLGILTPGHVLGVKDSLFSDVNSEELNSGKSTVGSKRPTRPLSPPGHGKAVYPTNSTKNVLMPHSVAPRGQSFSTGHAGGKNNGASKSSGYPRSGQYRLDPYLYSLDQNLLAMFENKDNAFHRRLRLLDQGSFEREKHKIGVVYVGPDQDEQKLILANEDGSLSYRRFIEKLGWKVDLLSHQGFNGGLNASTTGRWAKYFCTAGYEMIFHVATSMPTNHNDPQQTEKKKHVGNDQVNIIWTDNGREYIIDTIYSHFNQVQIVIYPLNNGLYRIKIHQKKDVGDFGPLLNNMIIRESLLSILVRVTALYANRTVRYAASVFTRPFVERKKYLDEAIDKNSKKSHESILGAFFPSIAGKQ